MEPLGSVWAARAIQVWVRDQAYYSALALVEVVIFSQLQLLKVLASVAPSAAYGWSLMLVAAPGLGQLDWLLMGVAPSQVKADWGPTLIQWSNGSRTFKPAPVS